MHGLDLGLVFRPDAPFYSEQERRFVSRASFNRDAPGEEVDKIADEMVRLFLFNSPFCSVDQRASHH
jgi:hypothetical protein